MKRTYEFTVLKLLFYLLVPLILYLDYLWYTNCTTKDHLVIFWIVQLFWIIPIIFSIIHLEENHQFFTKKRKFKL